MKPEYEGLDFQALFNSDWTVLSYSISDEALAGYFLLKSTQPGGTDRVALVARIAHLDAKSRGLQLTQNRYWISSVIEVLLPEANFNELLGNFISSDAPKLGQIITKFTVGGANP